MTTRLQVRTFAIRAQDRDCPNEKGELKSHLETDQALEPWQFARLGHERIIHFFGVPVEEVAEEGRDPVLGSDGLDVNENCRHNVRRKEAQEGHARDAFDRFHRNGWQAVGRDYEGKGGVRSFQCHSSSSSTTQQTRRYYQKAT